MAGPTQCLCAHSRSRRRTVTPQEPSQEHGDSHEHDAEHSGNNGDRPVEAAGHAGRRIRSRTVGGLTTAATHLLGVSLDEGPGIAGVDLYSDEAADETADEMVDKTADKTVDKTVEE